MRNYLKFRFVNAIVKEIAYKSLKTGKIRHFFEKSSNEKSIFATQWCQKCLKHVPIGLEHHNL